MTDLATAKMYKRTALEVLWGEAKTLAIQDKSSGGGTWVGSGIPNVRNAEWFLSGMPNAYVWNAENENSANVKQF